MEKKISAIVVVSLLVFVQNIFAGSYVSVLKGTIKGVNVTFKDNLSVAEIYIKTGYGECNGNYFEIPNDITYGLTSISGENFYYIYIDDSDAVYPILNSDVGIVHSTDEPKWDDAKQGWYRFYEDDGITEVDSTDKDDRCIGVVWIDDSNNLRWFNNVNEQITWAERSYLASNMSGNSYVWQQPNAAEGPTVLPKNAIKAFCYIHAACGALSRATVALTSKEAADQNNYFYASNGIAARGYPKTLTMGWVYLGESRKLRIQADNSNTEVHATLQGFEISR